MTQTHHQMEVSAYKHSLVKENSFYNRARQTNEPASARYQPFQPAATHLNMPAVDPTTGFIYPPTYSAQPNLYFDVNNPLFMQPYHYPYHLHSNPQYQSTFASTIPTSYLHVPSSSTSTTSTPHSLPQYQSTLTSSTSTSSTSTKGTTCNSANCRTKFNTTGSSRSGFTDLTYSN